MRHPHLLAGLSAALLVAGCGSAPPAVASPPTATAAPSPESAVAVARAYFTAMEAGELDAAAELFADPSSVYETGGQEGSFGHYASHHLGPELAAIQRFEIRPGEPEVDQSEDGTLAFVAYPVEYDIDLNEGREIRSNGTVTFVLVSRADTYAIRHLHWSSRPRRPAAAHGAPSEEHEAPSDEP